MIRHLSIAVILLAGLAASVAAAELVESSARSGAGRRVDIAADPEIDMREWRTFTIVTPPPPRSAGIEARDRHRMLRATLGVAFAIAGFVHAEEGEVDFVVEYRFDHPGTPPEGTTHWTLGRKTNWLEISLRPPDALDPAWRGRTYNVLRKKRNQRQRDEDAELRFHSAAEAIIDAFRTSRGETP